MTLIGSAYVEIRALDTNLQRDIDNAMKKIKDVTLNIQADVNLSPVRKKISELRAELRSNPLKVALEVDDSRVVDSLAEAHQLYEDNPLNIITTTDTTPAESALRAVREEYRHLPSTVVANATTAGAEAQLATLTRRRRVSIFPDVRIPPDVRNALRGLSYTIVGAIPADRIRASVTSILANFETLAIGSAKLLAVLGSVGAMALTTGANLLTFGADVGRTIGLLTTAPAIITALGLAMVSLKLGFKDFGGAFNEDAKKAAKSMAKLPKEAQAAVKAMKGLGSEIRKDSQGAFWKELGTSLQDMIKTVFPTVKKGLHDTSIATAKMTKGMLASFKELQESGRMETLFENINKGLTTTSSAVKPFFDAMNTLSVTASKHLERYGRNLTSVADRFDAWATRTSQSGEMDAWITQAGVNMHNLGKIVGETVNTFKGLSQAAAEAGGKSLADVAEGMKNIAGLVNSEPFKSKLVSVLRGARDGVEALGRGFDSIKKVVSEGTTAISGFLNLAGQLGGSFMTNLAAAFNGTGLGEGIIVAMTGAKAAMDLMKPAFADLGEIIGDVGEIAGVLFQEMAPGFNNLADTLQKVVGALKDGVIDVIPVFNEFIQNILMVLAPIIIGIAEAVGFLLEGFAALPEIVRNGIMALGLFLVALRLLNRPMRDTATGIRNLASPLQRMRDGVTGVRDSITRRWNTSSSIGATRTAFAGLGGTALIAAGDIGKAFGQMRWMAGHTGQAIAQGFRQTFSQIGREMQKLGTPVKAFASMMGRAMGEALLPREVRDGFKRVGTKLMDTARIYTGYFSAAKDKIKAIGQSLKTAFPASLLGPALKALPGEIGKTMAYAGQKIGAGVKDIAKTLAGPAVGYAMAKMKDTISTQALYASKRLSDIGKGLSTAVGTIKVAPGIVSSALGKMTTSAKTSFSNIQQSMAKAFNSGVLAAAVHPMTAPFVKMADAAKTGALSAASHVGNMAKSIGASINKLTIPARTAFAGMAVAASIHSGVMADKFRIAADRIGGNLSTAFRNAGRDIANVGTGLATTMGRTFTGIQTAANTAATRITDSMKRAGTAIAANFAPATAAIRGTFAALPAMIRPVASTLGDLGRSAGTAAGTVGALAGATAKWAGAGLLGALGGGWGLAIAGATAAVAAIADAQAKSKARVDAFSQSLDQQTGAMTNLTKTLALKSLFDGPTDDWDDFVRGVLEKSKTVAETLEDLGMDTREYYKTMSDPSTRGNAIKGLQEVIDNLRSGKQTSDGLAESLGISADALTGLSIREANLKANSIQHMKTKAEDLDKELQKAEEQIKLVAKATGVNSAEAAIMSKNYDTLSLATSSVSDKFSAFKENLRLVGSAEEKAQLGQKGYQQSLRDTATKIKDIAAANEGILLPSLFQVGKGFDFTKQAGADLHSALEGQVEGIQMLGTEAIQKALAEGKKGTDVQKAAIDAMTPAITSLKETLEGMGFDEGQIQGILDTFNLLDKDITAAISLDGAETVHKNLAMLTLAKDFFVNGDNEATLKVLPDAAKKAIEEATGIADGFAKGKYQAMLDVLDSTDGGTTTALAKILSVADGDFKAELEALDLSGPTIDEAKAKIAEQWEKKSFGTRLDATMNPFEEILSKAEARGVSFSGNKYTPIFDANSSEFDAKALAAQGRGDIFSDTTYTSKMAADTAEFEAAKAAADAEGKNLEDTTFTPKFDADHKPFDNGMKNVTISGTVIGDKVFKPTVDVNDLATSKLSKVSNTQIPNKTFSITALFDGATQKVREMFGWADGGIMQGNKQTFANGGINLPTVNSYANGGFENHVAQISRGQTPFRVWSEPETGGEAYIPLSRAKRPRSLKILEEVASMFGMSLSKSFANGGILSGFNTQSMATPSTSGSSETFRTRTTGVGASAAAPTYNFTVNPSQGLSEQQIAEAAMKELYWQIASR